MLRSPFVAAHLPRLASIKMVLTGSPVQNFSFFGDDEPLGGGLMGFRFHNSLTCSCDQNDHPPPLPRERLLDPNRDKRFKRTDKIVHHLGGDVGVGLFPAAKDDLHLYLVAIFQKSPGLFPPHFEVMRPDARGKANAFDLSFLSLDLGSA